MLRQFRTLQFAVLIQQIPFCCHYKLVFACGLLLALIISWNVNVSETGEITKQEVRYEVENIGQPVEEDAEVTEELKDMGRVYQDPKTGKYYVVED